MSAKIVTFVFLFDLQYPKCYRTIKQDIRKHSTIKICCLDVGTSLRSARYHSRYNNRGEFRHTDLRTRIEGLRKQQVNNLLFTVVESAGIGLVQIKNTHSI